MTTEQLDVIPIQVIFFATTALLWLALEGGYRIGQRRRLSMPEEKEAMVGAMVASILGLLALVLGFTFSMSAARFEERRRGVLEEANAIETVSMRSRLLAEPQRVNMERLLKEYVDVRVNWEKQQLKIDQAIERSKELHRQMWAEAESAGRKNPEWNTVGLFIDSLNRLIDMHGKRVMLGLRSRIPLEIVVSQNCLTILSMFAIGYQAGMSATARSPAMPALVLAFAAVLFMIANLDRSRASLIEVSQEALIELQKSMDASPR